MEDPPALQAISVPHAVSTERWLGFNDLVPAFCSDSLYPCRSRFKRKHRGYAFFPFLALHKPDLKGEAG